MRKMFHNNTNQTAGKKRHRLTWRKYHKWVGLVFTFFMMVFCLSGIVLNHRAVFSRYDVSRAILPADYHVEGYNNGVVRGTVADGDTVFAYGTGGVWQTNKDASVWTPMNDGFPEGVDHRNIRGLVQLKNGALWCATNYDAYTYVDGKWRAADLQHGEERINDITLKPDSTGVVVLSRSALYTIEATGKVDRQEIRSAVGYSPKETMFRIMWKLHSGELFGLPGRLVVDLVAVVIIFLCITGAVLFVLPYRIRRRKRQGGAEQTKGLVSQMKWNFRWHNRIGGLTIILTLFLTITGTCLRPPLMLPFVFMHVDAPGTKENAWHDRLRAIRWDGAEHQWLLSTADGFIALDSAMAKAPVLLPAEKSPLVSPMGINVFEQKVDGTWLIGSFSGLYKWNRTTGAQTDYYTGESPVAGHGPFVISHPVTGYSEDFDTKSPVVFSYSDPANGMPSQPQVLSEIPLSLWNVALELHVGRCYQPLIGPLSSLFVFLWGTLSVLVFISGYIMYRRQLNHRRSAR